MNRREFFSLAAAGAVASHTPIKAEAGDDWEGLANRLAQALERKHGGAWLVKADSEGEFVLLRKA